MKQSGYKVSITAWLPADANSPSDMADAAANVAELQRDMEGRGFVDVTLTSRFVMRRVEAPAKPKPDDKSAIEHCTTADALAALQAAKPADVQEDIPAALDRPTA